MSWRGFLRSDQAGLLVVGVSELARAVSYLMLPASAHWVEMLAPQDTWAAIWALAGGLALAAMSWRTLTPVAVGAAVGLHAAWGLSFLLGFVSGEAARGWSTSVGYLAAAALIGWSFARVSLAPLPPAPVFDPRTGVCTDPTHHHDRA